MGMDTGNGGVRQSAGTAGLPGCPARRTAMGLVTGNRAAQPARCFAAAGKVKALGRRSRHRTAANSKRSLPDGELPPG
jgi:hypothetical protein